MSVEHFRTVVAVQKSMPAKRRGLTEGHEPRHIISHIADLSLLTDNPAFRLMFVDPRLNAELLFILILGCKCTVRSRLNQQYFLIIAHFALNINSFIKQICHPDQPGGIPAFRDLGGVGVAMPGHDELVELPHSEHQRKHGCDYAEYRCVRFVVNPVLRHCHQDEDERGSRVDGREVQASVQRHGRRGVRLAHLRR